MEKQIDLFGNNMEQKGNENNLNIMHELSIWKSVLQKAIRRCDANKAMFAAYKLVSMNSWSCWKRLSTIADEDVGQSDEIVAVDVLYRKFLALKKENKDKELSWDAKRCALCAAKILAEAPKDRRSDEFLELMEAIEKHPNNIDLKKKNEELEKIPDEALDMHTLQGRKMGRGNLFWYEVSSDTVNRTPAYEEWNSWFKPMMIKIEKEKANDKH